MDDAIEDGIGECGIVNDGQSVLDRVMAHDGDALFVEAVVEDCQQVAFGFVGERHKAEVVEEDQVNAARCL